MSDKVTISLDWDHTFDTDKVMWTRFCKLAHDRGHKVYIVTRRDQTTHPIEDFPGAAKPYIQEIIYCSKQQKKKFLKEIGIIVDIWIDDAPERIV